MIRLAGLQRLECIFTKPGSCWHEPKLVRRRELDGI